MKKFLIVCVVVLLNTIAWAKPDVTGCWTTIDDETNTPKSIVQIYEYQGKYYGRVVELFQNKEATANLPHAPKIIGLDVIWDMKPDAEKLKGGEILDPKKGKVYACEIWRDGANLIVRGKIAFLGRNQTWLPNKEFKPLENLVPQKVK